MVLLLLLLLQTNKTAEYYYTLRLLNVDFYMSKETRDVPAAPLLDSDSDHSLLVLSVRRRRLIYSYVIGCVFCGKLQVQ